MSIRLQDITPTTSLALTDKILVTDGSSENLATLASLMGAINLTYQGLQSTTQTLTGNANMYKITLSGTGVELPTGASGMTISDGGVKVSVAGSYKITANLYLSNNSSRTGIYIFYGTSFTDGAPGSNVATELVGVYSETGASANKQATGIITGVPANTIFYLVGRAATSNATAQSGWLLVERMA